MAAADAMAVDSMARTRASPSARDTERVSTSMLIWVASGMSSMATNTYSNVGLS
jgi:hypothetical protein